MNASKCTRGIISNALFQRSLVGGIAFMTLCINGSTAGPLLIKLGLADSGNIRKRIVEAYNTRFKRNTIEEI